MFHDRNTLSNVPDSRYITVCDQRMVESGMSLKAGKTLPVFFFVNKHNNTNTKPHEAKKKRF